MCSTYLNKEILNKYIFFFLFKEDEVLNWKIYLRIS